MNTIDLVNDNGVAVLTLNRPEVLNALNAELSQDVMVAMDRLASDDSVKALVLTGAGRAFCAGADLSEVGSTPVGSVGVGDRVAEVMQAHFNPMVEKLYDFPKPTLCALNGIAAGGGAAMALCTDLLIASNSATLKFVQVPQLGIVADLGANWLLPRAIGRSRALACCLLGESIDAARMLEWGLAWDCVEQEALMPAAMSMAMSLGRLPAQAVTATRRLIDGSCQVSFGQLLEQERLVQKELCDLPVFVESAARFAKR